MDRFEKAIQELNKEKEDIELLLSSLEDAYAEAAITEKHYRELKTKNKKKLEEILRKIETIKNRREKREKEKAKKPETTKSRKKKEAGKAPDIEEESPPEEREETPAKETQNVQSPQAGAPVPITGPPAERKVITEEEFRSILSKIFEKTKLVDIAEIQPKLEKLSVETEKIKAFIDALKEEKNSVNEMISRINEELGELRSGMHAGEGRLSEIEMKVKEMDSILSVLKPERYSRGIEKIDKALSVHEARLDKLDDMTSMIMKNISDIKDVLREFGNMEQVARMSREISKKLISIDEREKRIRRISDKLDGIFAELNKRLDEFIFYKAKQENIEELVNELLRNIDEMNTKLGKFAEKMDIEALRDSLESKISELSERISSGMTEEQRRLQSQKEDIEDLLSILEEQHRKGAISDSEYEKAREENLKRLKDIEEKLQTGQAGIQPSVQEAPFPQPAQDSAAGNSTLPTPAPEANHSAEAELGSSFDETGPVAAARPDALLSRKVPAEPPKPDRTPQQSTDRASVLQSLEESFRKGLISREAYENARKLLETP